MNEPTPVVRLHDQPSFTKDEWGHYMKEMINLHVFNES